MHPQDEYSTPTRAQQVWSHFSGLFGADAIKRKYGATPPAVWESELSFLTDAQLRSGLQRLVDSGGEHVPTLPQFLVMCRSSREFETGDAPRIAGPVLDKWGCEANLHLLGYMMRWAVKKRGFTQAEGKVLRTFKESWAEDMRADDKGDGLPIDVQQAAWADCMERAEEQIRLRKAKAA